MVRRTPTRSARPTNAWMRCGATGFVNCIRPYGVPSYHVPRLAYGPPECLEGRPCLLALTIAALGSLVQIPRLASLARDDRGARSRGICTSVGSDLSKGGPNLRAQYANLPSSFCVYPRTAVRSAQFSPAFWGPAHWIGLRRTMVRSTAVRAKSSIPRRALCLRLIHPHIIHLVPQRERRLTRISAVLPPHRLIHQDVRWLVKWIGW